MGVGMAGVGGVAGAAQLSQQRSAVTMGSSAGGADAADAEVSALLEGNGRSDARAKEGERQCTCAGGRGRGLSGLLVPSPSS